jgi:hypothetical protein
MEINRNQYFLVGVVLLLLGLQLRMVDTFELSAEATKILAHKTAETEAQASFMTTTAQITGTKKQIKPPQWVGWCLLSIGSVLVLHSMAMKKPE